MLTGLVICAILAITVYALYWRSKAKDVAPLKAALEESGTKVEALEQAAEDKAREEHEDNVAEAKEIAAGGDVGRALQYLRSSVTKKL